MADPIYTMMFRALVARAGGVDAAAALIAARWGQGHKGTVSKMMAGQLAVTVEAVVALEDALAHHPITDSLQARVAAPDHLPGLADVGADIALATGRAHAAIVRAMSETSAGGAALTAEERAEVQARFREVATLADQVLAVVQQPTFHHAPVPFRGRIA